MKEIYFYICEDCSEAIQFRRDHLKDRSLQYCRACCCKRASLIGRDVWRGQKHTKESKIKMSKPRTKTWKLGPLSEETKRKISRTLKNKWKTDEEFRKYMSAKLNILIDRIKLEGKCDKDYPRKFDRILRSLVRERDDFTCRECDHTEKQLGYNLSVHHIDYNKENCDMNNLISLCKSCHAKTNFNRQDWIKYYGDKLCQ